MLRGSSLRRSASSAWPASRRAEHREEVGLQRIANVGADLARRAFGSLQRDIAGKAFGHHDVDRALADVVAFDKAVIDEAGAARGVQQARGVLDLVMALHFLGARH